MTQNSPPSVLRQSRPYGKIKQQSRRSLDIILLVIFCGLALLNIAAWNAPERDTTIQVIPTSTPMPSILTKPTSTPFPVEYLTNSRQTIGISIGAAMLTLIVVGGTLSVLARGKNIKNG
ncbi:MAG TPA: hypothetical protein VIO61_05200 [Anaerolineaceae bacterium]